MTRQFRQQRKEGLMNKRNLLTWMSLSAVIAALVCIFAQERALAAYAPPAALATPDYFGYANYANSPLPTGPIAAITLSTGGSGYSASPTVTIADFNCTAVTCGFGATATATVTAGIITAITVTAPGSGYFAPVVTITDPTGKGAVAAATLGTPAVGTGIRKFVDNLPGLCVPGTACTANGLGQYIPIANPNTTLFTGEDYYEIGLSDHHEKMHSDLPGTGYGDPLSTKIRGYNQINTGNLFGGTDTSKHYLGPLIIATKNRHVRVKFVNNLGTGTAGDLFIPVDTTYMGAGKGPDGISYYTQNRATLHLHGGNTPWISDGTPHQWVTPVGESTANTPYLKGDTFHNVPDMITGACASTSPPTGCITPSLPTGPSDGIGTFFWTNEQGDRLMFYHDHAYGLTRLNVYAGEAAGYLLVDPGEEDKMKAATAPGTIPSVGGAGTTIDFAAADLAHLVPLVIQDKTFVPSTAQISAEDPTWNSTLYSGTGGLWFPHIYTPNQNPTSPAITGGANPFGRWDYGPWFFPPQTTLTAANPPTAVTVPCTSIAYPGLLLACPITPNPSGTPEGFMDTPVINGTAYPVLNVSPTAYRFQILAAANDRTWNLSWFVADPTITTGPGVGKEVKMLPAVIPTGAVGTLPLCTTATTITNPALIAGLATAAIDAATGKPLNDTGLPLNCWPTTWPTDARVGGVPDPTTAGPPWVQIGTEGGLLPAPVVIPATPVTYERNPRSITITNIGVHGLLVGPAERADVIVDFSAFAGKTLILYNDAPAPVPAFDARLDYFTGDPDVSTSGGAPSTLAGYGPNTRTIMQVNVANTTPSTTFNLTSLKAAFTGPNNAYTSSQNPPIVPESAYNSAFGTAYTDTYSAIQDTTITFTPISPTSPPALAAAPTLFDLGSKAIQELFTLDYGRMNATLGVELPRTNFTIQTTVPLGYIDPPTETITDGETQIWKLTHNGVDTHFIHFHLVNVQVINRIGWDGSLRPPDENELGWKDTVRMNPLEDIVFAMKAVKPTIPFTLPNSNRLYDVTQPAGGLMNFTNIDPLTGNPIVTTNQTLNFGWEYVWHCHILGHEENDMMRPIIFQVPTIAPPPPTLLAPTTAAQTVTLTWTEPATTPDTGLVGFTIQRNGTAIATINSTSRRTYSDTTVAQGTPYSYQVFAFNGIGSAGSNIQNLTTPTLTPPSVSLTSPANGASLGSIFPFSATATPNGGGVTITRVEFYNGATLVGLSVTGTAGVYTFTWLNVPAGTYTLTAKAYDSQGLSTVSGSVTVTAIGSNAVQRILPTPVTYYSTLAAAFTAATGATSLQANGLQFTEPAVNVNSTGTVTFSGGWDTAYTTNTTGMTSLKGVLTVINGALVVGKLTIM